MRQVLFSLALSTDYTVIFKGLMMDIVYLQQDILCLCENITSTHVIKRSMLYKSLITVTWTTEIKQQKKKWATICGAEEVRDTACRQKADN